jgi:hypothetical protein
MTPPSEIASILAKYLVNPIFVVLCRSNYFGRFIVGNTKSYMTPIRQKKDEK